MVNEEDVLTSLRQIETTEVPAWLINWQSHLNQELIARGKTEAEALGYGEDLKGALHLLDRLEQVALALDDPLSLALVWRGRANVLQVHERYEESLAAAEEAAQLYQQHATLYDVAVARTVEVMVLGALERFDEAIALAHWIRPTFQAQNFTFGLARLAGSLAQVYTWGWQLESALLEYQQAEALYSQLNMPLDVARVHHNRGYLAERLDRLAEASHYYQLAYPHFVTADDVVAMVKTQFNLSRICQRHGQYEVALEHLARARTHLTRLPDSPDSGYVDLFEARIRRQLHQPFVVEGLLRQSVSCFQQLGRHLEAAEALVELGHHLVAQGSAEALAEALTHLEQAESCLLSRHVPLFLAWVQLEQAELLYRLGRPAEAVGRAEMSRHCFAGANLPLRQAQAQVLVADCLWRQEPARARQLYEAAANIATAIEPLLAVRSYQGLGRLALAQKDWLVAEDRYRQAVGRLEEMRRTLSTHYFQAGFWEDKTACAEGLLAALQAQPGREADLLTWVERFKAAALADLLAQPDITSPFLAARPELVQQREQLSTELDRHLAELRHNHEMLVTPSAQRGPALLAHDSHQAESLRQLQQKLLAVDEQITRHSDPLRPWREGVAVDAAAIQAMLDEDTVLIAYYTLQGQLIGLTVTPTHIQVRPLPISLADLDRHWQQMRRLIIRPTAPIPTVQSRLAFLWQQLIAPLQADLRGKKRLLILPHRHLFQIPFSALFDRESGQYLCEKWQMHIIPSATILAHCQQQASQQSRTLLVGYPGQPDQPDYLPGVVTEIQTLAELLPASDLLWGEEASMSRFLAQAGGYGLVHLAGHAQYDSREPVHSGMPLAGDRWLRAADLYLHPGLLQGATVVLSSCESGRGRATGQEVLGLTTAFLVAGASGVVAGLWRVDDTAAVELMTRFYRVMMRDKMGVAAALQQAQQQLLSGSPYTHPYYWSPFALTGASNDIFHNC